MAIVLRDRGDELRGRLAPQGHLQLKVDHAGERYFAYDPFTEVYAELPAPPLGESWTLDMNQELAARPRLLFLLKQLVWALGAKLDESLCAAASMRDPLQPEERQGEEDRKARDEHGLPRSFVEVEVASPGVKVSWNSSAALQGSPSQVSRALSRYLLTGQEMWRGELSISIAADATRIGNKNILLSALVHHSNKAMWLPPQVMRDFRSGFNFAKTSGDKRELDEHTMNFRKRFLRYLKAASGADVEPEVQGKKRRRIKSMEVLLSIDNALVAGAGFGLDRFQIKLETEKRPPWEWPHLSLALDQGSDGLAASHYAIFGPMSLNCDRCDDLSHGAWNDVRASLREVGLWKHELLMVLSYNVPFGPFDNGARHHEAVDAVVDYMGSTDCGQCPLFAHLLPDILNDMGQGHRLAEERIDALVWEELAAAEIWRNRGMKISLNRFMGAIYKADIEDKFWHRRLLGYLQIGLELGYLDTKSVDAMKAMKAKGRNDSGRDDPAAQQKETTRRPDGEIAALRKVTSNALHIACLMYANGENQSKQRLICEVSRPIVQWHQEQNRVLRSTENTLLWEVAQLQGEMFVPFRQMLGRCSDAEVLDRIGIESGRFAASDLALDIGDPKIVWQDEFCSLFGRLTFALLLARLKRLLPVWNGWPRRQSLFLCPNLQVATAAVAKLRNDWANFRMLQTLAGPAYRQMEKRSIFKSISNIQLVRCCEEENWRLTARLEKFVSQRAKRITCTQLIEDGFNRQRRAELKSANTVMSLNRLFGEVVRKKVLGRVHKYAEIQWERQRNARNLQISKKVYKPSLKQAQKRADFRGIAGFDATPKWHSPGATNVPTAYADGIVMEHCRENECWDLLPRHGLCILLRAPCILVRAAGLPDAPWYFNLGDINGSCGFAWKARRTGEYFVPDVNADDALKPIVVLDPTAWEAWHFEWHSPLRQAITLSRQGAVGIAARPIGVPEALHTLAAKHGWWQLPVTALTALRKDLGCQPSAPFEGDVFTAVKQLTESVIPDASPEDVLKSVECRLVDVDFNAEDFEELDGGAELLEKEDRKEVEEQKKVAAKRSSEAAVLAAKVMKLRCDVRRLPPAADPNPRHKKSPLHKVNVLAHVPPGAIEQHQLKQMLPPGASVWAGRLGQGCWAVHLPPYPRFSKSWALEGHRGAALACLRHVWDLWLRDNRLQRWACPVAGLFSDSASASSSA